MYSGKGTRDRCARYELWHECAGPSSGGGRSAVGAKYGGAREAARAASPSGGASSDEEGSMHDVKPALGDRGAGRGSSLKGGGECPPAGKKTKGRVKIKMEFIDNKLRRYTTFSKRKTGIMKKVIIYFFLVSRFTL